MNVATVNDLRAVPRADLLRVFGNKVGTYLYSASRGEVGPTCLRPYYALHGLQPHSFCFLPDAVMFVF